MNTITNLNTFPIGNSLDGVNIINEEINTLSLLVDGTNNMIADLNMDNHIIKNLDAGVDSLDAVNKSQLDLKADATYVNIQDNLRVLKSGDTMSGPLTLNYATPTLNIRGTNENQSSALLLSTPFNNGDIRKTAIIASGITSYSRANLHFCLNNTANNTTNVSLSDSKMVILNSGDVGIGITAPSAKLDVNGTSLMRGNMSMAGIYKITNLSSGTDNTDAVNKLQMDNSLNNLRSYVDSQDAADRTYIDASLNLKVNKTGGTISGNLAILQNVSIGLPSFYAPLTVSGETVILGRLYSRGFFTEGKATISEAVGTGANANNGSLTLEHSDVGGKSSIVFKSKVNETSDYGYIEYRDNYNTGNSENSALIIGIENDATGSTIEDKIYFKLNGADRVTINGSGNVGIGTINPSQSLDVSGNAIINGIVIRKAWSSGELIQTKIYQTPTLTAYDFSFAGVYTQFKELIQLSFTPKSLNSKIVVSGDVPYYTSGTGTDAFGLLADLILSGISYPLFRKTQQSSSLGGTRASPLFPFMFIYDNDNKTTQSIRLRLTGNTDDILTLRDLSDGTSYPMFKIEEIEK